jgi:serine/threonine protein kinase
MGSTISNEVSCRFSLNVLFLSFAFLSLQVLDAASLERENKIQKEKKSITPSSSSSRSRSDSIPNFQYYSVNENTSSAIIEHQFHQKYEFIKILGRGSSAEVHLCRLKSNPSQEYAVKIVKKDYEHSINDSKSMKTETTIMKLLHHHHVLSMYELYETENTIWMVLDHANGGDLMHGLASLSNYNEKNIAKIFYQLLLGMKYLHSSGIIHRDLKMDNLLYSTSSSSDFTSDSADVDISADNIQLKIADFGLSAILATKRTNENSKSLKSMKSLKEMWGTVEYFAPEVYHRSYGYQADLWALGCILYEMLVGEVAFPSKETDSSFFDKVMKTGTFGKAKSKRTFEYHSNYQGLSSSVKSLIKGMLKRNPKKRFDIDECLAHPWIQGAIQGEREQKDVGNSRKTSSSVASSSSVTLKVLPAFYETELVKTKKVISDRATRRRKRYEMLVNEIEREQRRSRALASINA